MLYKTLAAVSIMGTRAEKGEIVEVPTHVYDAFGPDYLVPADLTVAPTPGKTPGVAPADETIDDNAEATPEEQRKNLESMKLDELKELCSEMNLATDGKKSDLVERILLANVNNK
ncbi:SAP domain containing protein [uncultured Caudovirales phage]|uniref:SAP domain containing protein n=1 Tax=uncultured Caudovirales phage TaxID=2100421 RepID=A0A6J5N7C9_9CAUD|nr:SAP domain containing protein [uncultured Caudovirales phage]